MDLGRNAALRSNSIMAGESGALSSLADYFAADMKKPLLQLHRTKIAIKGYRD